MSTMDLLWTFVGLDFLVSKSFLFLCLVSGFSFSFQFCVLLCRSFVIFSPAPFLPPLFITQCFSSVLSPIFDRPPLSFLSECLPQWINLVGLCFFLSVLHFYLTFKLHSHFVFLFFSRCKFPLNKMLLFAGAPWKISTFRSFLLSESDRKKLFKAKCCLNINTGNTAIVEVDSQFFKVCNDCSVHRLYLTFVGVFTTLHLAPHFREGGHILPLWSDTLSDQNAPPNG